MTVSIERVFVGEQPVLEFVLVDQDGKAIDLTGLNAADVTVHLRKHGANENLYTAADTEALAISSPATAGKFTWRWPAVIPEDQEGVYTGQVKVVFDADHIRSTEPFNLNVVAGILS